MCFDCDFSSKNVTFLEKLLLLMATSITRDSSANTLIKCVGDQRCLCATILILGSPSGQYHLAYGHKHFELPMYYVLSKQIQTFSTGTNLRY